MVSRRRHWLKEFISVAEQWSPKPQVISEATPGRPPAPWLGWHAGCQEWGMDTIEGTHCHHHSSPVPCTRDGTTIGTQAKPDTWPHICSTKPRVGVGLSIARTLNSFCVLYKWESFKISCILRKKYHASQQEQYFHCATLRALPALAIPKSRRVERIKFQGRYPKMWGVPEGLGWHRLQHIGFRMKGFEMPLRVD